jgi:CxxC-x17-CxxC domain-containing protein
LVETVKYEVMREIGKVEVRSYPKIVVAKVENSSEAFNLLYKFITEAFFAKLTSMELIYRMFKYEEKYKAVCSECGLGFQISAEVDASEPIYCQECYWRRRQLGEL